MPDPANGAGGRDAPGAGRPATLAIGAAWVACVAVLLALGVWQVERRAWKLDLIDRVGRRVHAAPVAAPDPAQWPAINRSDDEYKRVTLSGRFLNDRETLVQALTVEGPGYWVVTPLQTADGLVLVNRGFVPSERREPASRSAGNPDGVVSVTGLLRISEPGGGFLRHNDPQANRWYSRDIAAIAAARGLSDVAPFFVDADATPNPGGYPVGGLTVIAFPNNHLVYALTWFTLALMLAGAGVQRLRRARRDDGAATAQDAEWDRRRQSMRGHEASPS
ncbi:putative SURF1 family protein [Bradyrhizobium sp. ORS 285]|uniref:SURF1 family protein n=1 Tax=Bradyrhizobium sp. ORS 285 TaxID=115808 RepID=UPI00024061C0|nr:SURF1 family protein [Bradyrhizobium sp. ORS 285]CCD86037.1 putative SURF1 family protein [Bradyrhizobium sp. ORS 285]SMX56778.1 putative SURF1 family protein [Bradyrhizobium sp. ORS 285]